MSSLENLHHTFCNEGESVTVLAKKLSPGDIQALNKAADILAGNLAAIPEQTTSTHSVTARNIGSIAANGITLQSISKFEGQAIQAGLF